jgi:pSer/pThr/pTyr-binding forkhead associated (FHA) protein
MARLLIISDGFNGRPIELRLGVNRVGRGPDNDIQIEHVTVSALHCELVLDGSGVFVRDIESTNGTFVAGEPVQEARLTAGQTLHLGDVEILVEDTEVKIEIPKFTVPRPAPPVVLVDGSLLCPRHPEARVTHQCTHCREMLCDECVNRLRRRGGKVLKLCCLCSHKCEPLGGEKKKKRSILAMLQQTVKLPFARAKQTQDE